MSLNFNNVPAVDWIGQVYGQPTVLCELPKPRSARIVPVQINWALYPQVINQIDFGVIVNMEGVNVVNELDRIVTVYIDNLGSPTPIYVWFPDTGFTVVAGPGQAGWAPVVTNQRFARIYGLGFVSGRIPVTTVYFANFFVPPSGGVASGASLAPALTPLILNYITSEIWVGNNANVSFPTVDFGPLSQTNRYILTCISGANLALNARQISSIDVAGNVTVLVNSTGSLPGTMAAGIISDNTNLSGDIEAIFNDTVTQAICHVYSIENLINPSPISAPTPVTATSPTGVTLIQNISIPARGVGIAFGSAVDGSGLGNGNTILIAANGLPVDNNTENRPGSSTSFRSICMGNEFILETPSQQIQTQWSFGGDGSIGRATLMALSFGP